MPLILPLLEQKQEQVYMRLQTALSFFFGNLKSYMELSQTDAQSIWDLPVGSSTQSLREIDNEYNDLIMAIEEEENIDA